MIYNKRVILITETTESDFLGDKVVKKQSEPIPCQEDNLTNAEQMGIFGKYSLAERLQKVNDYFMNR